jgi:hypothetical protein
MRHTFFILGASCHQGGIHRADEMPGTWGFLPQTLRALERRKLIIFHGGQYSHQRIEMTEFGKELWREVFKRLTRYYYGDIFDEALEAVFAFKYWGTPPPQKKPARCFSDDEFSLFSLDG